MKRVVTSLTKPTIAPVPIESQKEKILSIGLWIVAGAMVLTMVIILALNIPQLLRPAQPVIAATPEVKPTQIASASNIVETSYFPKKSVVRATNPHTEIPETGRKTAEKYIVAQGDSLFGISTQFGIKPNTVFWANFKTLKGSPDMLAPGMELIIPPNDGVYYQWKAGDTLQSVAEQFYATPKDILQAPINQLDLTNPVIEPGNYVMIPGGTGQQVTYFQGSIPRGSASTLAKLFGDGNCDTSAGGLFGTGAFMNPMSSGTLIGNDYIDGVHQGIDLGSASYNSLIMAADSGLVVYSGWANGGYGNTVMIDHGGGYQSLYAHMSEVTVSCGSSVTKGQPIGIMGSTGNSTGPHLHFEIRYMGLNDNPWNYIY